MTKKKNPRSKVPGGPYPLERVEVQAKPLDVVRTTEGDFVVLGSLLAPFGKEPKHETSRGRLAWADVREVRVERPRSHGATSVNQRGAEQTVLAVRQDQAPMVIARLDLHGMGDDVRAQLVAYIRLCSDALFEFFTGRASAPPAAEPFDRPGFAAYLEDAVARALAQQITSGSTGKWRARKFITSELCSIAKDMTPADNPFEYRAIRGQLDMELRGHLGYTGAGRTWDLLPESALGHARVKISEFEHRARTRKRELLKLGRGSLGDARSATKDLFDSANKPN